jgi:hypothetical protein
MEKELLKLKKKEKKKDDEEVEIIDTSSKRQ